MDIEVKITSMQGTHVFRRDRTTKLIKCTPWTSRLHHHPAIIKKMRTFLELERKLGPIPQSPSNQFRLPKPDTNPNISKITENRRRITPIKRFKAKIAAKPYYNEATYDHPKTVSKAPTSLKIQTPSQEGTPENRLPSLEGAPICTSTPWSKAGKMSGNLFKTGKVWLIPPNYNTGNDMNTAIATSSISLIKIEPKPEEQPANSPMAEKCGWGPNCPFCKNIKTGMVTTRSSCNNSHRPRYR